MFAFALASSTCSEAASAKISSSRACLKNHSYNLHAPICGIFCLHSVDVARYAALIQAKSPANCDAHLAESIFQTRSRRSRLYSWLLFLLYRKVRFLANHWTKIARTEAGIQIERHRFRRYKNLLHQPRHQTNHLHLRNGNSHGRREENFLRHLLMEKYNIYTWCRRH